MFPRLTTSVPAARRGCVRLRTRLVVVAALALVAAPAAAEAQWYFVGGLGGNHTPPADVAIRQPTRDTSLDFHQVYFKAKALTSPQYYDWHLGKLFGTSRHFGLELEFIHLKVIADTARAIHVTGVENGAAVDETAVLGTRVERYSMTHGLNFVLLNFVARMPIGGSGGSSRLQLLTRVGAGATLPHAETNVFNESKQLYEWAGPGYDVAAGVSLRLRGRLSAVTDYKLTFAKPRISLAVGTGQTTALTHQFAIGFAFGLSR